MKNLEGSEKEHANANANALQMQLDLEAPVDQEEVSRFQVLKESTESTPVVSLAHSFHQKSCPLDSSLVARLVVLCLLAKGH